MHLHVGSVVKIEFPSGKRIDVRLLGTYKKPNGGSPFGDATISTVLFDRYTPRPRDEMVLINTPDGVSDANTQTLKSDVSAFADAKTRHATSSHELNRADQQVPQPCSTRCFSPSR